jgi:hypothetical protein
MPKKREIEEGIAILDGISAIIRENLAGKMQVFYFQGINSRKTATQQGSAE